MNKGQTLIELLIIVAVIGILAAIVIPIYNGWGKDKYDSKCAANLVRTKEFKRWVLDCRINSDWSEKRCKEMKKRVECPLKEGE